MSTKIIRSSEVESGKEFPILSCFSWERSVRPDPQKSWGRRFRVSTASLSSSGKMKLRGKCRSSRDFYGAGAQVATKEKEWVFLPSCAVSEVTATEMLLTLAALGLPPRSPGTVTMWSPHSASSGEIPVTHVWGRTR